MTEEQITQWNYFGCGSRCIIKLSEFHGKPISADKFIEKFGQKYEAIWKTHLGLLDASDIIDCCRELGLCGGAKFLRNPRIVKDLFRKKMNNGIFLITDLAYDPETGRLRDMFHTRLILSIPDGNEDWQIYHPDNTGKDCLMGISLEEMEAELSHFLVLQ